MKKVLFFLGTRPEVIKLAPVIYEMRRRKSDFSMLICSTGQHKEMLSNMLLDFDINPDFSLSAMTENQTLSGLSGRLFESIDSVLVKTVPDVVIVQGDTSTVMVAALASFYRQLKIAHVEAGLRSHDKYAPFPEEINRRVVSVVADYHFAPTNVSKENLLKEGIREQSIFVTGNTVVDAILLMKEKIEGEPLVEFSGLDNYLSSGKKLIVTTCHRRESFDRGIKNVCNAIRTVHDQDPNVVFVLPVHLNPNIKKPIETILTGLDRVLLVEPQSYRTFVKLLVRADLLLTDSGGVQEEGVALGKLVLVLRDVTERPEGIKIDALHLIGTDPQKITESIARAVHGGIFPNNKTNPYGDGHAAERIVDVLKQ